MKEMKRKGSTDEWGPFILIGLMVILLPLCVIAEGHGEFEKTIYVVEVTTVRGGLNFPHTRLAYTFIQPGIVTEPTYKQLSFLGTTHDFEAGHSYKVSYTGKWYWMYPVLNSVEEIN